MFSGCRLRCCSADSEAIVPMNGVISPIVEAKKCSGLNGEISPIVEMTGSIDDGWLVDSPASGEAGQRENHIIL